MEKRRNERTVWSDFDKLVSQLSILGLLRVSAKVTTEVPVEQLVLLGVVEVGVVVRVSSLDVGRGAVETGFTSLS